MAGTAPARGGHSVRFVDAPTRTVTVAGVRFVYRELGDGGGTVPLVGLTHLGANLDSWDPALVDPLAENRRVILFGYRGVGASTGKVRDRFEDMASDVIAAIRMLGLSRVDLLGLSMGGMVVEEILHQAPGLVDRVIVAGAGPQGGPGLTAMTGVTVRTVLCSVATFTSPTSLLFFTRTPPSRRAAKAYQQRLKLRHTDRDKTVPPAVFRAQLSAVRRWGHQTPPPALLDHQALIVHGDSDRMVPPANAEALRARFSDAKVRLFSDSGHGVASQNHEAVTDAIERFLQR